MGHLTVNICALGAGALSHISYFRLGEHHNIPWKYVQFYLLCYIVAVGSLYYTDSSLGLSAARATVQTPFIFYFTGLYTSLIIYRLFFHPLCKFPGPILDRLSTLVNIYRFRDLQGSRWISQVHEKYGTFVRTGSSDLSTSHPDAVEALYGNNSRCIKAPGYDTDRPAVSLHSTRNRAAHDARRRIWSPAFSDRALRGYETRIRPHLEDLVAQISVHGGQDKQGIDITQWFNFFAYDVMGDLAFGTTFNMLKTGEEHWAIACQAEGMKFLGYAPPPWLMRFLVEVPGLSNAYWRFFGYCNDLIEKRIHAEVDEKEPDVFATLMKPYVKDEKDGPGIRPLTKEERSYLQGDARLIVVAGSDTTYTTLTFAFYHLAKEPAVMAELRAELAPLLKQYPDGNIPAVELQNLPYLNGVINESLRLHPPVPTNVGRLTPPEGITVGDTWIPGGIVVTCPQYVVSRDPQIYPSPLSFLPNRWSTSQNPGSTSTTTTTTTTPSPLLTTTRAYAPFSTGPYNCIGKNLALMDIRMVIVRLLAEFPVIAFAEGEDGGELFGGLVERFTVAPGGLRLVFRR